MKYRYATKPYPHQVKALRKLLRNRGGGLQVPMRWGKSKVGVDFANCLHLLEGIERVLVVTVLSGVGVWENEIIKHTPEGIDLDWRIINFERTYDRVYEDRSWIAVPSQGLKHFDPDLIIVDESHHIGNPSTLASKMLYQLGKRARFRVIMTGTMFHRKPFYVYGQMRFMDPGIFGDVSFSAFKRRIAVFGGYAGYEVLRYQNLGWMMKQIKPYIHTEKYVQLRPPVVNPIYFHLTGENLQYYAEMEKESIIDVRGSQVISPIILSRHLRCQQIAGGWVKTEEGTYRRVGTCQRDVARDRLDEYMEQDIGQVVIGCRFTPEVYDAAVSAGKAGYRVLLFHGGLKRVERDRRVAAFQDSVRPTAFVAQLQTGKESIDLSVADTMMFYSLSESYVVHDQFSRRIEMYNEKRTLMYDYLIPRGTRTEVTFESLQQKRDVADLIAEDPDMVERITSQLKEDQ